MNCFLIHLTTYITSALNQPETEQNVQIGKSSIAIFNRHASAPSDHCLCYIPFIKATTATSVYFPHAKFEDSGKSM